MEARDLGASHPPLGESHCERKAGFGKQIIKGHIIMLCQSAHNERCINQLGVSDRISDMVINSRLHLRSSGGLPLGLMHHPVSDSFTQTKQHDKTTASRAHGRARSATHLSATLRAVWRKRAWSFSFRLCSACVMRALERSRHCRQFAICCANLRNFITWKRKN